MTQPAWTDDAVALYLGDCVEVMRGLPEASVHSIVTDPPYDLTAGKKGGSGPASLNLASPAGRSRISTGGGGFMGKTWDSTGVAFDPATWREALRVLKPGGFMLAFGGTRTWHRLACAVEDAGFEIRDSIHWIYSQGFPKSLDVGKAIDKAASAERAVIAEGAPVRRMIPGADQNRTGSWIKDNGRDFVPTVTAPATEDAKRWDGWGTALKPAHEPIILARKPLAGTVAENVLEWGCGAINIGATRIGSPGSSAQGFGGETGAGGCAVHSLRHLREGDAEIQVDGRAAEVAQHLRPTMPGSVDGRPAESELAGRDLAGRPLGLQARGDVGPARVGQGAASEAAAPRVPRASAGDGAEDRPTSAARRDGSSHQRSEGRQPSGELAPDGLGEPLPGASADRTRDVGAAPAEPVALSCTCGSNAPGTGRWPTNLVLAHAPSCRPDGTRRIKGSRIDKPSELLPDDRSAYGRGLNGARPARGIGDADGLETVEAWDCAPGCVVADLDRQSGQRPGGGNIVDPQSQRLGAHGIYGKADGRTPFAGYADVGGASRYFPVFKYEAKAGSEERPRLADGTTHPTVKPVDLMRWLVKLITPPGGLVLDCFAGSGTTGEACVIDAFKCVLIERDPQYAELIKTRLRKPIALDIFGGVA